MNKEFTRGARYVVLKNADIMQCLTVNELIELRYIQARVGEHRAKLGKPRLDCVVVESDWPEYEPTWRAIEARVTGAQQAPDGSAVQSATRIMNVDLIRQHDALHAEIEGGGTTVIVSKFPVNPTDAPLYALPGVQTQGEEE